MSEYTESSAMRKLYKNAQVKTKGTTIYVLQGSAGNGTLGVIDYLTKYVNRHILIVKENFFKSIKER